MEHLLLSYNMGTFTVGLEISLTMFALYGIFSVCSFAVERNKWLALIFFSVFWVWFNLLIGEDRFHLVSFSGFLQNPVPMLIFPIGLFFYTRELVFPHVRRKQWLRIGHLVAFIVLYIIYGFNEIGDPLHFLSTENKTSLYGILIITPLVTVIYGYFTLKLISRNKQKLYDEVSLTTIYLTLDWIKWLVIATMMLPFVGLISTTFYLSRNENPPEFMILLSQFVALGCLTYFALRQPVIYEQSENDSGELVDEEEDSSSAYNNISLGEGERKLLIEQFEAFMQNERPYLNPKVRMPEIAEQMGVPRHILSYLINSHYGVNFFQFINGFRIDHASKLLQDEEHENYTIEAIGKMSGFNSKTTFNNRFKEITGMSPTEFQQRRSLE